MPDLIDLRWTLRDIKAGRLKLTSPDLEHVRELIDRGLVELQDDIPVITEAGLDELGRSGA
jgi:hypothetical protein